MQGSGTSPPLPSFHSPTYLLPSSKRGIHLAMSKHTNNNQQETNPPWTFAPRAAYLQHDRPRAMKHFNLPRMKAPKNFPVNTIQAQRALTYIKATHGAAKFEEALMECFEATWQNQEDLGSPDVVRTVFARVFGSATELDAIMEASAQAEWKKALTDKTKEALERGAYGAPWFWVRNCRRGEEREGPFFGSDRFAFMWEFLGLGWRDVEVEHLGTGGGAKL